MRKITTVFTLLMMLFLTVPAIAQRAADWTVELTGKAQQIILQQTTGIPIIQTEKAYIGVDPNTQKSIWTIDRSADKAMSGVIEMNADFYNMEYTPYVLVRNNLVDSRSGERLMDKERDGYKRVEDYEIIPSLNSILIRTTAEGNMLRLFLVNMTQNKLAWKTDVVKLGLLANVKSDDGTETEPRLDLPVNTSILTSDKKHLVYQFKKNVACVEVETGKLLWAEKANPTTLMLSPDEKTVLVIEAETGGLVGMATATSSIKLNSNTMKAFTLTTGAEPWKKEIKAGGRIAWVDTHPDFLTVVHRKGVNLYDYATGEPFWKKEFEGRRVVEIQPNDEGYLITYHSGYKKMQLGKDGKPLWKKPQVEEFEDGEIDVPEDGGFDRYYYEKGDVLIDASAMRFAAKKGSGLKSWRVAFGADARLAYDESRKNLVVLNNGKVMVVNPDKYESTGIQFKVSLNNAAAFHTLEIREQRYFLTSSQEYVIINPDENLSKHKYYKRPFDSKGMWMDVASAGLSIGAGAMAISGLNNAAMGGSKATAASVGMMPPGSGNTEIRKANNQLAAADAMADAASVIPPGRFEAFKQSRDFAYYFASEKDAENGKRLLIKVNKDSGEEVDKLIFDDARPLYQIDEIQRKVYYANNTLLKVFNI